MTADTGLMTDRYEFTMLASFIADGTVDRQAVFETFARRLPTGRRYGIAAGLGRLVPLLEQFRFDADELDWLLEVGAIDRPTAGYLRDFRFRGTVDAIPEGDLYFPGTPVVTVSGTLGECILLETLVLSVINHDTAIASAAARMVTAAQGRPIIEMGSRRVHEEAAIAAGRAAYLAGFSSTSNLAAGRRYGVPTVGTAAHAFTLAHESELDAFRSQVGTFGVGTTLLVDTYDIADGIRNAVAVAREHGASGPGAIRIDSGDLDEESRKARALLDSLGATETRVTVTSDLDEYVMTALAQAPIDGYGAGTRVATGSGHPTAGMVYKIVSIQGADGRMRPVAKTSAGKSSIGGRKTVLRRYDPDGLITAEEHLVDLPEDARAEAVLPGRVLAQQRVMAGGEVLVPPSLSDARERTRRALTRRLPPSALDVADGPPAITPTTTTRSYQEA